MSDKAGFRLQYMEVYNWGTFDGRVFKINPQGNNSLLTGANASGKSTFIDALLTLLVPVKKDRFYNQSSGVEKKGDRSEETYVCGNYGTIQKEGDSTATTQTLRGKDTYSVLLASFSNTDQKVITIFQVRWFANGELKRVFGVAHVALSIEKDFYPFDSKGDWKKRLDKVYNSNSIKKRLEILDGPSVYGDRISSLFGMRSRKGLSLFNQIVGVKVLDDLDEFIRTNMLEELDAEAEYRELRASFTTLMDAKVNIEKAKEQIAQLTPIDDLASALDDIRVKLDKLNKSKELAVYWFTQKRIDLSRNELDKNGVKLDALRLELVELRKEDAILKEEQTDLTLKIKNDKVGEQIQNLKNKIIQLVVEKNKRVAYLNEYNELIGLFSLSINPSEATFNINKEQLEGLKEEVSESIKNEGVNLQKANDQLSKLKKEQEGIYETINILKKNANNISGREAVIRDEILEWVGATREEIPFIGELIRVKENQKAWESSIEKVLHSFALRLIVPDKYYEKVNEYLNNTNLRGRIGYQRYSGFTSIGRMANKNVAENSLVEKIEYKQSNEYTEWLEDMITNQYDYACISSLSEFNRYEGKAITQGGLMKFNKARHEKDDRPHLQNKSNYVLGWDNKEKIANLISQLKDNESNEVNQKREVGKIETKLTKLDKMKEGAIILESKFLKYENINWEICANQIKENEDVKTQLEASNNPMKILQRELDVVESKLKNVDLDLNGKNKDIYRLEDKIEKLKEELEGSEKLIKDLGEIDTTEFEMANSNLINIKLEQLVNIERDFRRANTDEIAELNKLKIKKESEVRIKINEFKQPKESVTSRFLDWRSDVSRLPESTSLEFISEYQDFLKVLKEDNLPKFEKKFNEYLEDTIIDKVGQFRIFFTDWECTIKENIRQLNDSLKGIDFRVSGEKTYIQIVSPHKPSDDVRIFRQLLDKAVPNIRELGVTIEGKKNHFDNNIEPFMNRMEKEDWRKKVMDVRAWFSYKAEEFNRVTSNKFKTYENMGQLSGGEKAQLTYTILGSAIAYQFGLTKEGLQSNSFRFIAIDEAFKAQDEDKARYLISLCKQLHLQLLVVTPSDNIHIVENDISYVHFVERKEEKTSWLYDMPIEQFQKEREKIVTL